VLTGVRGTLRRDDAQLALRLIGRESRDEYEQAETMLRDFGLDSLLDDPRLVRGLLEQGLGASASYRLFSYVIVRHALFAVGEADRSLADYVGSIFLEFGLRKRALRVAEVDDEEWTTLSALAAQSRQADPRRALLVQAHLGNYALWLSGIFPDYIESRRHRRGAPPIDYYEDMGKLGFSLAAANNLAAEHGMAEVFGRAADRFATLREALNRLSDERIFPNVHTPDRLLRQVRDGGRWKA